jgi:2-polyprenyl-3-methyl-5-hydroxy-6-metoxy-1,4-benzoquinol methylase
MVSQKYDLVISVAVLHHLPSLELRHTGSPTIIKNGK